MSIIIYNINKKREITPPILLPAPKCIIPFINKVKIVIKNNFV